MNQPSPADAPIVSRVSNAAARTLLLGCVLLGCALPCLLLACASSSTPASPVAVDVDAVSPLRSSSAPPAAPATPSSPFPTASAADRFADDAAALQRGAQLFRAVCTGYCHSTNPKVPKKAPNLFDCEWDHGGSDQEIFNVVYEGIADTQMQGFGGKLPDDDLWKLLAYVRSRSICKR